MNKMKKIFIIIILAISANIAVTAQTKLAESCGSGCDFITVQSRTDRACGNDNDYTFTITNNTNETLDIKLFTETNAGEWSDQGLLTDVTAGKMKKDCFWGCKLTGRTIIYYRTSGSRDRFPTQSELRGKAASGDGSY